MKSVLAPSPSAEYAEVNAEAWRVLAENGCDSSQPYGPGEFSRARTLLDPEGWLPWDQTHSVVCLAAAGGQQAPLFAKSGCTVVSVDISDQQLALDRQVADAHGLSLETLRADMLDLSPLHGRDADLVYQAVSACYVPDVRRLYREVRQVLRPNGRYWVEHWNPVHLQLAASEPWDGSGYRVVLPQQAGVPIPWTYAGDDASVEVTCWHYIHPLDDLLGGLCDEGFVLERVGEPRRGNSFADPGSHDHLAQYLPPFVRVLARLAS